MSNLIPTLKLFIEQGFVPNDKGSCILNDTSTPSSKNHMCFDIDCYECPFCNEYNQPICEALKE